VRKAGAATGGSTTARAYSYCAALARTHYENFPVASLLLPKAMRPAIAAIYAFARRADDIADEPGLADAERLRLLEGWQARLRQCQQDVVQPIVPSDDDLVFLALGDAMRRHRLPIVLFEDLLSAFRQDVTVSRYRTWADVLDYCTRSANPVGRLVLRVAGFDDPARDRASDAVCTALQLTNFWQDFARDWQNGRLYVPIEDRDRAGARDADLDAGRFSPAWHAVLRTMVRRTRELFDAGRPVCDLVAGRLAWELRLTWHGGVCVLDRIDRADFDPFRARPALGVADALPLLWRAATWKVA